MSYFDVVKSFDFMFLMSNVFLLTELSNVQKIEMYN